MSQKIDDGAEGSPSLVILICLMANLLENRPEPGTPSVVRQQLRGGTITMVVNEAECVAFSLLL